MAEDVNLRNAQEELKRKLADKEYQSLMEVLLERTGRPVRRIVRVPDGIWLLAVGLGLVLVIMVISTSVSLLLGERYGLSVKGVLGSLSMYTLMIGCMIASKMYVGIAFKMLREGVVDAIVSTTDLTGLEHWLAELCDIRKHLRFSVIYGLLTSAAIAIYISAARGEFTGFGALIFNTLVFILIGVFFYYLLLFAALPVRLSRYEFKLYTVDPSSSEVISQLSGGLNKLVYIAAVLIALATIHSAFFELTTAGGIAFLILLGWAPLVVLFAINQHALRTIISTAKWKTLNEIQAKIESLQDEVLNAEKNGPTPDTLACIRALIDYHDQIKGTRGSAMDLRAGLNFLNSLLLPTLSSALANYEKVLGLLGR